MKLDADKDADSLKLKALSKAIFYGPYKVINNARQPCNHVSCPMLRQ